MTVILVAKARVHILVSIESRSLWDHAQKIIRQIVIYWSLTLKATLWLWISIIFYKKVIDELEKQKGNLPFEYDLIIYLIHIVIFNDPTQDCNLKGKNSDWKNLPFTKSLFHAEKDCRLPIGNLTSQLFGNIYMNEFVHFVKRDLDIKYYGRYVDDFILIHPDKGYLLWMIKKIDSYLSTELNLQLHPHKIYLQHYTKGVAYLVAIIKPHRTYVGLRIKGNFYQARKE